ncbi:MAG: ExbD/TolR family protein [Armatimonadota bacterium]
MRFKASREIKHTRIEIIPMIDTMFFLLVFFILASLNIIDLRGINIELPPSAMNKAPVRDPRDVKLEVEIDANGNKYVNDGPKVPAGDSISKELLAAVVKQFGRQPSAQDLSAMTVIIAPDETTFHEHVISAIDDSRSVKIGKFAVR